MVNSKQLETVAIERTLTGNQLAEKLQVHPATVRLWRSQGMPHTQFGARLFRYNLEEVNKWAQLTAEKKTERKGE